MPTTQCRTLCCEPGSAAISSTAVEGPCGSGCSGSRTISASIASVQRLGAALPWTLPLRLVRASPIGQPEPAERWVEPAADPADDVARRDTVRLAFIAALQHLSPQQRAALVLRDVLSFSADEAAGVLCSSAASVESALARARRALAAARLTPADPFDAADPGQRALLADYVRAFESHDLTAMAQLLHDDVQTSMPPFEFWVHGHDEVHQALASGGCADARMLAARRPPTARRPSGSIGRDTIGLLEPFGLVLVETRGGRISAVHTFLFTAHRFADFGLPGRLSPAR